MDNPIFFSGTSENSEARASSSIPQAPSENIGSHQLANTIHDLQFQSKTAIENAISESLNKLNYLFDREDFASMDRALNEVAGLVSIRLKDEYHQIRSVIYNSVSNIISSEFSKATCFVEALVYQLQSLRDLSKEHEMSLARRESVIEVLKSEIDQLKIRTAIDISKERKERKKFCNQVAYAHARRALAFRMWKAWKRCMESSWKQRAHLRFFEESQQICVQLSRDYEIKIAELKDKLRTAEERCVQAEMSQARAQESMKFALMRGVCALNMEAMSVLHPENELGSSQEPLNISIPDTLGGDAVGSRVKGNTDALKYLPNRPLVTRSLNNSQVKFSTLEPIKTNAARYNDSGNDPAINALFRTQTVEYGNPVGPSHYSSANLSKIRVQRYESIEQASTIPRGNHNNPRLSIKRSTPRNKIVG